MKLYTKEHEWIESAGDEVIFGITQYAVGQLGDITFVELPEVGETFNQHDVLCSIESVKAASDIYMPLSGTINEVNEDLDDEPEKINNSPEEDGWIAKISISDPKEKEPLMDEDEYKAFIEGLE